MFLTASLAEPVEHGLGLVNLEAVVFEQVGFDAVQMLAGHMEQLLAFHAFEMKMPLAFRRQRQIFIARTGA